jgi:hypothetical protein
MHSKDKLAEALREVGLTTMADAAATGYYHDFLSPLPMPSMALAEDLAEVAGNPAMPPDQKAAVLAVRERHLNGDFDATAAESDEWAASPEGREAMSKLASGR